MELKDYRPSGYGKHRVMVTLMSGKYKADFPVEINGNCVGGSILESAQHDLIDRLIEEAGEDEEGEQKAVELTLTDEDGNTTIYEQGEDDPERWIEGLIVGIRIVAFEPEGD